jgi:hypothetical protein
MMLTKLLSRLWPRTKAPAMAQTMADADRAVIRAFAQGDKSLRNQAVTIHRRYIPLLGVRGTPEQDFMAEVDNPCPDFGLRSTYRNRLLKA